MSAKKKTTATRQTSDPATEYLKQIKKTPQQLPAVNQTTVAEMMIAKAPNRALVQHFGKLTTEQVIKGNYTAIAQLQLDHRPELVHKWLAILVNEASTYFEEPIKKERALDIAVEITAKYYYLTLEDIMITLRDLKHTKLFGKLTANKVLAAIATHANQRAEIAGQMSLNAHLAQKQTRSGGSDPRKPYREAMRQYTANQLSSLAKTNPNEKTTIPQRKSNP